MSRRENEITQKTLLLHIGMGKTGTTALQNFFWKNRGKLAEHGILYPNVGVIAGAHHLLSPHHPVFLKNWHYLDIDEWAPKLLKEQESRILLSSELIAWVKEENAINFSRRLAESFQVKIVLYLRRQDHIIMAGYNQQIKAGTQINHIDETLDIQLQRFDYAQKIRPWDRVFGKTNILIRPYERNQFYQGNLLNDFMHHVLNLEMSDEYIVSGDNANPRLSNSCTEFKRLLNNIFPDVEESSKFNAVLLKYSEAEDHSSKEIFSSEPTLSPKTRREILQKCKGTNTMIARNYLGRDDGILFYEPIPEDDHGWESKNELSEQKIADIAQFIKEHNPHLMEKLREIIIKNLDSSKGRLRKAAIKLQPVLESI